MTFSEGSGDVALTLFVSGASDLSAQAIAEARHLCDVQLHGRCQLRVVDVHADAGTILSEGILATPTLVKDRPLPARKHVGSLADVDRVLRTLHLPCVDNSPAIARSP